MSIDIKAIIGQACGIVAALEPVLAIANPPAAAAVAMASKIAAGVLAAEPAAVALFEQITSGEIPSDEAMAQFAADYEAAYQQLHADLAKITG